MSGNTSNIHRVKDNITKIAILPKLICRFDTIPIKISAVYEEIDKLILKFM